MKTTAFTFMCAFCFLMGWCSSDLRADICFVMQTTQPCENSADPIEQKVCFDTACTYEITSYESTVDPQILRPVLTWRCPEGTSGIYEYNPFQEIQSCEQSDTAKRGAQKQEKNNIKKVCFYRGPCGGGCVKKQGTFQLPNRLAPGVTGALNVGVSTYQRHGCEGATIAENDRVYNFAEYYKCKGEVTPCADEEAQ